MHTRVTAKNVGDPFYGTQCIIAESVRENCWGMVMMFGDGVW